MVILRNKEDWRVYPEELARRSRDSVRVVRTCLEELERVGYVRTYRKSLGRGKGIQYYRFCSDKKISEQAFKKMITDSIQLASFLPEEAYNIQKEKIDNLAETLGCDVVVIEASYDLKFIDGEDVPELTKEQKVKSMVNGMFEQVFGGE